MASGVPAYIKLSEVCYPGSEPLRIRLGEQGLSKFRWVHRRRGLGCGVRRVGQPTSAAVDPGKPTCPCCGGRMIVIEVFERGATPRPSATSPTTSSGSTAHDRDTIPQISSSRSLSPTGHGRARPDIRLASQIVGQLIELDATRRSLGRRSTVVQLVASARSKSASSPAALKSP